MELFGSSTHTLTHTRTQHIRFQSINIAYTQRAPWHKKDAAAGDKQTNKQTKPNQSDVGTIHKFEQGTNAEAGGAGAEGRGGGDSTPGQVERFKKKNGSIFRSSPRQDVDVPAWQLQCLCPCKDNCVRHCYISRPPPSFPLPPASLMSTFGRAILRQLVLAQRVKSELDFSPTC